MSIWIFAQFVFVLLFCALFIFYFLIVLAMRRAANVSDLPIPPVWKLVAVFLAIFIAVSICFILLT